MRQALAHRLTRLEQQAHAHNAPLWHEIHAAAERLRSHAVATLTAALHGQQLPARDETQARTDSAMFDCWCRAHGTYQDSSDVNARLQARPTTIAARYAADPPRCIPARSAR
jgi:hypothetical protein